MTMLLLVKLKPNSEQIRTNLDKFGATGLRGEQPLRARYGSWRRAASGGPARHSGGPTMAQRRRDCERAAASGGAGLPAGVGARGRGRRVGSGGVGLERRGAVGRRGGSGGARAAADAVGSRPAGRAVLRSGASRVIDGG
jgi:hypothetical protein